MRMVVRATMTLLHEVIGGAVLLFNYETIIVQRIDNQLIFNKNDLESWIASELDDLILYKNNTELATA